ncbi:mitotic-spindle organizing protein 2 isoform X1 [Osmerus eperlanus]|uniref:mitotic-spindle organizing protein 2 isoform X1 n=1 Tax=Osmerus eperlanus TaxID=29151 RepID=UPI002E0E258C
MSHSQPSGPLPSAPDSPALGVTVSGNVQKYAIKKKKILNAEESELFELTQAAGISIDQEVFKIIVDLLKMNVAPQAVFQTLKAMCAGQRVADISLGDSSSASHTTTANTATPSEPREDDTVVSVKSSRPPAPPPSSSGPRASRGNTKIGVHGPQEASSSHPQVRSKAGVAHGDKTSRDREGSSQRLQRQASATRGQKTTKSSASSSSSSQMTSN